MMAVLKNLYFSKTYSNDYFFHCRVPLDKLDFRDRGDLQETRYIYLRLKVIKG